jgi:hypothetical protein
VEQMQNSNCERKDTTGKDHKECLDVVQDSEYDGDKVAHALVDPKLEKLFKSERIVVNAQSSKR